MNLWLLLTAAAFLSAVSASHLTTYEAQQDDGDVPGTQQDDYDVQLQQEDDTSDAGLESLIADLQQEDDTSDAGLESLIADLQQEDDNSDAGLESLIADLQQEDENSDAGLESLIGDFQQEDDNSDAGLESLIADLQREDDDEVFEKKLEALIQQGSEEDGLAFAEDGDDGLVFETQDGDDGMAFTAQDGGKEGGEDSTAVAQWNNRWDGPLRVICPAGYGLYRVYSVHNNHREDRLFRWYCKRVYPTSMIRNELKSVESRMRRAYLLRRCHVKGSICNRRNRLHHLRRRYLYRLRRVRHHYHRLYRSRYGCFWRKINRFRQVMHYGCPTNSYLTGLTSRHLNKKEDREWNALCCRTKRVCLKSCRWTGYINHPDRVMNFRTSGIMTGLYSYYSGGHRDRRWKVRYCYPRKC